MSYKIGNFEFDTHNQRPLKLPETLIQYTRYLRGNLITVYASEIEKIVPYPKKKRGGNIIFKNGAKDIYYGIWPLTLVNH